MSGFLSSIQVDVKTNISSGVRPHSHLIAELWHLAITYGYGKFPSFFARFFSFRLGNSETSARGALRVRRASHWKRGRISLKMKLSIRWMGQSSLELQFGYNHRVESEIVSSQPVGAKRKGCEKWRGHPLRSVAHVLFQAWKINVEKRGNVPENPSGRCFSREARRRP